MISRIAHMASSVVRSWRDTSRPKTKGQDRDAVDEVLTRVMLSLDREATEACDRLLQRASCASYSRFRASDVETKVPYVYAVFRPLYPDGPN
ncbi:hypothetical protein GCM10010977_33080 [Citricoccus zhacaiensis]|uniref:Uncharacterized protein n=1 Tax=Citricoccus zhacaiensis TaxID=489142 RepID=A0ABQ2MCE2_9MICC|nr:hypothetical protein GCM10010977_33080 [Citricoccus zhacaiensis]